jgi:hypothetical protein
MKERVQTGSPRSFGKHCLNWKDCSTCSCTECLNYPLHLLEWHTFFAVLEWSFGHVVLPFALAINWRFDLILILKQSLPNALLQKQSLYKVHEHHLLLLQGRWWTSHSRFGDMLGLRYRFFVVFVTFGVDVVIW